MTRPFAAQLARASRFLFLLFVALAGFAAFAQDVLPPPAPAPTTPDTILGWVLKGLLAVLFLVGAWGAKKLTDLISANVDKAKATGINTTRWNLLQMAWLKAQAVGGKLLSKEKPLLDKILSDGVVTADEFTSFKNAILIDLRDQLLEEIPMLSGLIGGGGGAVSTILDGFASKIAHSMLNAGSTAGAAPSALPPSISAPVTVAAVAPVPQ